MPIQVQHRTSTNLAGDFYQHFGLNGARYPDRVIIAAPSEAEDMLELG